MTENYEISQECLKTKLWTVLKWPSESWSKFCWRSEKGAETSEGTLQTWDSWSSSFKEPLIMNKKLLICAHLLFSFRLNFSFLVKLHSLTVTAHSEPCSDDLLNTKKQVEPALCSRLFFYCFCFHGNTLSSQQIIIPLSKEERVGVPRVWWKTEEEDRVYKYSRAVFFWV